MSDVNEKLAESLRQMLSQLAQFEPHARGSFQIARATLSAYESRKGGGVDVEAMRYDIGLLRLVAIKSEWFESEDKDNPVRINIKAFADKLARAIGDSHE